MGSTRSKDKTNAEGKENQKNAFHKKVLTLGDIVISLVNLVSGIGNKVFSVLLVFTFSTKFCEHRKADPAFPRLISKNGMCPLSLFRIGNFSAQPFLSSDCVPAKKDKGDRTDLPDSQSPPHGDIR